MDILLSTFVKININKFNKEELEDLDKFLDYEDEFIYDIYQNKSKYIKFTTNKIVDIFRNFKI